MPFGTFSQPIKVISKLNQLKKKDSLSPAVQQQQKKRVTNDAISSMLSQLNHQVQRQQKCIELIMGKLMLETPPQIPSLSASSSSIPDPLETLQIASTLNSDLDIDNAFQTFMLAYGNLPSDDRKTKLSQMLSAVSVDQ